MDMKRFKDKTPMHLYCTTLQSKLHGYGYNIVPDMDTGTEYIIFLKTFVVNNEYWISGTIWVRISGTIRVRVRGLKWNTLAT
jgi:hypothetical protein